MSSTSPSPAPHPRDIFLEALDKATPAERAAFLDGACRDNAALRGEVEKLLANHREDAFLEASALSPEVEAELARLKPEDAGELIGPYKLREQIGEGGFGVVWVADQEHPVRRRVALKIIKMGMDTKDVIARFEQERQALAMMDHPNIAKVLDAGATQHGRPYFVMELVRGVKITDYCDDQQLSTEERIALFITVCQAVQHAHQKGIIHRDLKPSNILVTINDGKPVPKVIDFGVAKATQGRLTEQTVYTQFQQMIGTPLYMSPEQAEMTSLDIDTRSDIYSLGVLLYELLTGHTPIEQNTLARVGMDEIRRIIREVDPPRPSLRVKTLDGNELTTAAKRRHTEPAKLSGSLRGDLDWIVMKCIEKDRARRYDTANGLALDLQRHLRNEVVIARPPTAGYMISKLIRRNKLAVTAGAAIAASLVIGTAASVWQAVRADREAKRAKTAESQAVAALDELRSTAPAFAAQARSLAGRERFAEAVEKLDYAIKLRPDVIDHLLAKADLLQCQLQLAKAATAYRAALSLKPDNARAQANAVLCDKLQAELDTGAKLSRESLMQLFLAMVAEHRPAAELLTVGRMVGEEKRLILDYWVERLKILPLPPIMPIEKRLTMLNDGTLELNLSRAPIDDLTPLEGMPLSTLNLSGCSKVADLRPLNGLPLRILDLDGTKITDLAPLAKIRTLKQLDVSRTEVRDLSPLSSLPLEKLLLDSSKVVDLAPLHSLPLRVLSLRETAVSGIQPLAGMPLETLDCTAIPTSDFSAIAGAPLKTLFLQSTRVGDLSFLHGMPLDTLALNNCALARGYKVLAELKSLKVLLLTERLWSLPLEELVALASLRQHPTLRQIEIGVAIPDINTTKSAAEFWKAWDRDVSCILALHRDKVKFSTAWRQDGGLSVKIDDAAFKDLSVFRGANLASLTLHETSVSDLTPLAGLPLKNLQLTRIPVTDLSPLAGFALEELKVKEMQVTDISFLGRAPLCDSLTTLWLEYLKVRDFSPVAACKGLTTFSAYQSSMTDLAPLRGLRLEYLYISGTQVHDLSGLAGMPLDTIFFDLTPVSDITHLLTIPSLRNVILPDNLKRIEALKQLPKLQRVSFYFDPKVSGPSMTTADFWKFFDASTTCTTRLREQGIKIKSFKPLEDGTWHLDLESSTIQDLAVLSGAPISILRLGEAPVSDLSPLRGMPLKKLYINHTKVTDLSALKGMPLEELLFDFTPVTDVTPLLTVPSLKVVMLPEKAGNVDALRKLPNLQHISFFWDLKARKPTLTAAQFWKAFDAMAACMTRLRDAAIKINAFKPLQDGTWELNLEASTIEDLSVLSGAPISILRLGGTPVSDLSPLHRMPLKKLYLQNTMVTDLSPIKGMLLESLHVNGTKVTDLSPAKDMRLESLNLGGTHVADLSVLRGMPLLFLRMHQCPNVVDLSPLKNCTTLQRLTLPTHAKDFEFLRTFPKLDILSYTEDLPTTAPEQTVAKFWEEYDAKKK